VRFDDRVTGKLESFATRSRIIHIDIDPAEIHKNKTAHIPICSGERFVFFWGVGVGGGGLGWGERGFCHLLKEELCLGFRGCC